MNKGLKTSAYLEVSILIKTAICKVALSFWGFNNSYLLRVVTVVSVAVLGVMESLLFVMKKVMV
jgi:hypothetical protein